MHSGDNPTSFSLFVDSDGYSEHQRWHCYACGAGGDAIDFVMNWQGVDLIEAARWLAEFAGMQLDDLGWTKQAAEQEQRRRSLGELRDRAMQHYQKVLGKRDEAQGQALAAWEYTTSRGWADETVHAVGLGLADGQLWHKAAEMDASLDDLWRAGLVQRKGERYWDAIPRGYLVYPHRRGQRVEFMAGRAIWALVDPENRLDEAERKARKARNLHNDSGETPRCPFRLAPLTAKPAARVLAVVEGQADAITLAQAGVRSEALAGSSADEEFVRRLTRSRLPVVLGLDGDEQGQAATARLAQDLYPLTQVLTAWPDGKDANDALVAALQAGKTPERANQALVNALQESPTWLDLEIRRAATVTRRKADVMRELFRLLVQLDDFELEEYRDVACARIPGLKASQFSRYLAAAQREAQADAPASKNWAGRYVIEDGRMCAIKQTQGGPCSVPLCNFVAQIVADVARDDGEAVERVFEVTGRLDNEEKLDSYQVPASNFARMDWINDAWGVRAVLRAGSGVRDQLREALQLQSIDAPTTRVYTHTGWRVIRGERVFLSASGALGATQQVQVDLDDALTRYALPTETPSAQALRAGMEASISFLDVAEPRVSYPLWSAMYLAPLAEILEPAFVLWLYGASGALKSTLTALALCHYGCFTDRTLPVPWIDTANSLEMRCFTAKDVPLVIDDFAPSATSYDARLLERNASRIVRAVGNRAGRGRLTRQIKQQRVFRPRGLVVSTGEQLPSGHSITARLVTVEFASDSVNRERLTAAQAIAADQVYQAAMAGYLAWIARQWDEGLGTKLLEAQRELRARSRDEGKSHLRLPEALANLYIGLDLGLAFAVEAGALTESQANERRLVGWEALLGIVRDQSQHVQNEKPARRFLAVIGELLTQERLYLAPLDNPASASPKYGAELVGYYNDSSVYLLGEAAYRIVVQRERESGSHFPEKRTTLYRNLANEDLIIPGNDDRKTVRVSAGGRGVRVLWLSQKAEEWVERPVVDEVHDEEKEPAPILL